ncbi:MAG TPA: RnfABCDGE type electron transport complex subunit D [Nitrospiria bacterium]
MALKPSTYRPLDPRVYQISTLTGLLIYGIGWLDFDIETISLLIFPITALISQFLFTCIWRLPKFDPKSALISGLSLCLLLRTNQDFTAIFIAIVTIGSKFIFRWKGKHLFNPTNFGIAVCILLTGDAWVSPGQWGSLAFFGFLMACLGGLVVNRSSRSDVTYAFLVFYLAIVFGRAIWLGQPFSIPLHILQNGAFLLFTFFMISDPKTTPNSRAGRILFALLVAIGAGVVHFILFRPNGLIWSLAIFSLTTPFIDRWFPGGAFQWKRFVPGKEIQNVRELGKNVTEFLRTHSPPPSLPSQRGRD